MEEKFELPEENKEILSPLTEEELKGCLTGEEFLESALAHLEKLFEK